VVKAVLASADWRGRGSPDVLLTAKGASGNGTADIRLPNSGPVGSSYMTPAVAITVTNVGTVAATEVALQLTDTHTNSTLEHETWACLYSGGSSGGIYFNEPLTSVEGYGEAAIVNLSFSPGASDTYTVVYYAGPAENTGCGGAYTGWAAKSYEGYSSAFYSRASYSGTAPALGANPAAASLTNPAEGGSLTPTVTLIVAATPPTSTTTTTTRPPCTTTTTTTRPPSTTTTTTTRPPSTTTTTTTRPPSTTTTTRPPCTTTTLPPKSRLTRLGSLPKAGVSEKKGLT
jgi:hypothetical protein